MSEQKELQNHISEEKIKMKEIVEMGSIVKMAKEIIDNIITKIEESKEPLVEVTDEILIEEKVEII